MVELADIKKDLPLWPDDVIEEWLLRLANRSDTGWPPPELGDHVWKNILGNKSLSWWRDVNWNLEEIDVALRESTEIVSALSFPVLILAH